MPSSDMWIFSILVLIFLFLAGAGALAPLEEDFPPVGGENMMVPSDGAATIAPVDGGAYGTYSWAPIANLTQPRLDFAAAVIGTTMYVAGGVGPYDSGDPLSFAARRDSAEHCCTAMGWIFILAYCFAVP